MQDIWYPPRYSMQIQMTLTEVIHFVIRVSKKGTRLFMIFILFLETSASSKWFFAIRTG